MEIVRDIIYTQNKELLETIANDMYTSREDKEAFLHKYHKKGFTYLQVTKRDNIEEYKVKIKQRVK